MSRPIPTRIFHITPIANLAKICASGEICSKNVLMARDEAHESIAHATIQSRRATKPVTCAPGGVVHDYVPFYYAPRSPMLYAIQNGKVLGCPWRQEDIVHIESSVENVAVSGGKFVIYPISAALDYSVDCYDTIAGLDRIDWSLFFEGELLAGFAKYFHSRAGHPRHERRIETRQAEFLIHGVFPLSLATRISVINAAKQMEVASTLAKHGVQLPVEVQPNWYFLGQ
jgi:ssDNA thymidine ADP-ribosyltransferase, DarT